MTRLANRTLKREARTHQEAIRPDLQIVGIYDSRLKNIAPRRDSVLVLNILRISIWPCHHQGVHNNGIDTAAAPMIPNPNAMGETAPNLFSRFIIIPCRHRSPGEK